MSVGEDAEPLDLSYTAGEVESGKLFWNGTERVPALKPSLRMLHGSAYSVHQNGSVIYYNPKPEPT